MPREYDLPDHIITDVAVGDPFDVLSTGDVRTAPLPPPVISVVAVSSSEYAERVFGI